MSEPIPATELTLTRTSDDRRWFALEGVGWIRFGGVFDGYDAELRSGDTTWIATNEGMVRRRYAARTASARPHDGAFTGALFGGGAGAVDWKGRAFTLTSVGLWKPRLRLEHEGTPLAEFIQRSSGSRPVQVLVAADDIPPGLLLFLAYVSRDMARQARRRSGPFGGGGIDGGTSGAGGSSGGD